MHILAIDCGSTNLKAALFDGQGGRTAEAAVPVRYTVNRSDRVEMDPEAVWRATRKLIRTACEQARIRTRELTHLAFASQAQTFTVVDSRGRTLRPFLSWLDKRAVREAEALNAAFGANFHRHCSFTPAVSQLQTAMILWTQRHHPDCLRPGTRLVSLPGFLALRLAGINAMDRNIAAMSGLYSMEQHGWWKDVVKFIGLDAAQLPQLVETGQPLPPQGRCRELNLSPKLKIVFAGNDQTAGAFGNDCGKRNWVVTLGTALVAYRHAGHKRGPYHSFGCWGPYPGGGYYELAVGDEGCPALDWAREQLLPGRDVEAFNRCAESDRSPEECALRDAVQPPFFIPTRRGSRSAWVGRGTRAQRARAVFEGIGFSLRQLVYERLEAGASVESFRVTGGGSKSALWRQMLADILDRPLRRATGDALTGAARMAGARPSLSSSAEDRIYTPRPRPVAFYARRFKAWRRIARP